MKVYLVMVKDTTLGRRYLDTTWGRKEAAVARMDQLMVSFQAFQSNHSAWIIPGVVEDVDITREGGGREW